MDPTILDTTPITDTSTQIDTLIVNPAVAAASADLRVANNELKKLPYLIAGLGPGMLATKAELEDIQSQKSGLLCTVNTMVDVLEETRKVSSLDFQGHLGF